MIENRRWESGLVQGAGIGFQVRVLGKEGAFFTCLLQASFFVNFPVHVKNFLTFLSFAFCLMKFCSKASAISLVVFHLKTRMRTLF